MSTWKTISVSKGADLATVAGDDPSTFKQTTPSKVSSQIEDVIKDLIKALGKKDLSTDYDYLDIVDGARTLYKTADNFVVGIQTKFLDEKKLNALAEAIKTAQ